MDQLTLLLTLVLGALVTIPVAQRFGLPAPVLMTLLGGVLALLPFVPNVDIPPDYILPLVLPPLLYAAVQRTSWRQFTANVRPILLLAVALVFVTTAAVAATVHAVVPGLPLAAAVVLGALVAPPDPIAATSIAGSLGLPRRLVSILVGEGLFNDVTAIVLYHVAIAATVTGTFSVADAAGMLALSTVVALAVGFALGWAAERLMRLLDDPTLKIGCTLLVPFAAYVIADEFEGSGVLAVLVTALYLSEYATDADDVLGRLAERSFWDVVETLVTGIAFGLIGLELHTVVGSGDFDGALVGAAAAVVGVVVGVRLLWLLPASWLAQRLHQRGGHPDDAEEIPTTWRETVVMWWSGMRGVASVALVLAIPVDVDGGGPFPHRSDLLFITFAVVLATLICQGLTLPWLVRRLGVGADTEAERRLERELALRAAKAARVRLAEIEQVQELPEEMADQLQRAAYGIATRLYPDLVDEDRREAHAQRLERVRTGRKITAELLSAARHELIAARSEGYDPEIVDRVLRQLDVRSVRGGAV